MKRRDFVAATALGSALFSLPRAVSAQDKDVLRVGVIGHTGRGNFGHGLDTLWKRIDQTVVVAVADPEEGGREKARERLGLPADSAWADFREMLSEENLDIVAVAPRHIDQHRDMILAAVDAGVPGLYVEKPFCRDLAEADEIVEACTESGARLALAHRNRYHPVLPVLREEIEAGRFGRLLEIRCRGKEDQRGGALDLWVLGSHLLNLALFFAGKPVAASATILQDGRPVGPDEVVEGPEGVGPIAGNQLHARFETSEGVPVFFDSIQGAGTRESGFGLQLVGTEGIIDLRADREPLAHLREGSPFSPLAETGPWIPITSAGVGKEESITDIQALVGGHAGAIEDLIAAMAEEREPLCGPRDGRDVLELTLGVFASHRQGGARVDLPLDARTHAFLDW